MKANIRRSKFDINSINILEYTFLQIKAPSWREAQKIIYFTKVNEEGY